MTRFRSAIILSLSSALLAGCASVPATEAPAGPPLPAAYMALGTEPFWNLEITPQRLNFRGLDLPAIVVANPGVRQTGGTRIISAGRIRVTLTTEACSDGMSERAYADTAVVVVDGRTLNGCGGPETPHPPASLERSGWRITAINGQPALVGVNADINFADGRITGSAGCNRITGPFVQDRNRLTFGALAATRMACIGPSGEQEGRILAILRQPLNVAFGERMTMTWTATDGSSISLRRLDWD